MSTSDHDPTSLYEQLAVYRKRLAHALKQRATFGPAHTPYHVQAAIDNARAFITHLKKALRDLGESVPDHPDDTEPAAAPPDDTHPPLPAPRESPLHAPPPATTLRLTQTIAGEESYRVEVSLEGGGSTQSATAHFNFAFSEDDRRDWRWYLEDYLQNTQPPAPTVAARVEQRMAAIGQELFTKVFEHDRNTMKVWNRVCDDLPDTRVEIVTDVAGATAIPWELLHDPQSDAPLALQARQFVHAHPQSTRPPRPPEAGGPIRVLLVICRPGQDNDVPFRSVASRLVKNLTDEAREQVQLDVLRPPSFAGLSQALQQAKAEDKPYHVVHFDGHGTYADSSITKQEKGSAVQIHSHLFAAQRGDHRTGRHGYLLFENATLKGNIELINGPDLGELLYKSGVPVLVLNACRSAHAERDEEDAPAHDGDESQAKTRAFGSLAQEVMDCGVAAVVAMRYNVYVVTAAQFVADFYASLASGATVGQAVSHGRRQLYAAPQRQIADAPIALQDWAVPVSYESSPVHLFPKQKPFAFTVRDAAAMPARGVLDEELPPPPDIGFFGRDETLLALDRGFDTHSIALLHAYAGSGKTATAAEFARWYSLTGGVDGPVLFSSFERYTPLFAVLGDFGRVFGGWLEQQQGIPWPALNAAQRRDVALQVLRQIEVLWIWDNVEQVAGFPTGTPSAWTDEEQRELVDFLRDVRGTQAKVLLTSRRDERGWVGDLPRRIAMPMMPMREREQMARGMAARYGKKLDPIAHWRPLLRFTRGNPLTVTVVVGQALREGRTSEKALHTYVQQLRAGEAAFADEAAEGRTRSLGASLAYGFEHSFNEEERARLALLALFQGFVDVTILATMGNPKAPWHLPTIAGITREECITLLDRAAEVGLLTAYRGGYYGIHPALPWFFRDLFTGYWGSGIGDSAAAPQTIPDTQHPIPTPVRAFVEAMGELGNHYHRQYNKGNRSVIDNLSAEEDNLLHARRLARTHGWWMAVMKTMQGLKMLYGHTGRRAEWARLVQEIVPDFVDPATDGPLPGREEQWGLVTEYRVRLARESRDWERAARLQHAWVEWNRQRAAPLLERPADTLSSTERNTLRSLAMSLGQLGQIQQELGQTECAASYEEAASVLQQIGNTAGEAITAFNLGHAYLTIPALRDLAAAEQWYRRSLELRAEGDRLGRAQGLGQLGRVAHERFTEARAAGEDAAVLVEHLNAALQYYQQALAMTPPDAVNDLAVYHGQLGLIYKDAGQIDAALHHYRESIRFFEAAGDHYGVARTRRNVALALRAMGNLHDALLYARAAVEGFARYGSGAAADVERTQWLVGLIEGEMGG